MSEPPNGLPPGIPPGFVTAGHAVLFEEVDSDRCDVCGSADAGDRAGAPGAPGSTDSDDGYDVRGSGLLVWSRGEERRYQEPPLCAACAAAIGVSALHRWETEEDEG
jgi:hypothetical protein